ncbi:hypothetical protein ZIOFF_018546 [Zingiber officinale]|uniref:Pentatricopeptide repeat-containing protein n=1 Tax=Zingiber officinale TaxID=94328 RepID=A0A8J5LB12_ZINOF|nr:hypothetical protein ZIOFF_018546 [Zingiber officinale]
MKSYRRGSISLKPVLWSRYLSSQAGANSGGKEDDLEDGFSDLEIPLESADWVYDVEANEAGAKKERLRLSHSPIFELIIETPRNSLTSALDKYVEEGKPLGRGEISIAMLNMRKRLLYSRALQFVEWLEARNKIELVERDYASHLDLNAKVNGLLEAEEDLGLPITPFACNQLLLLYKRVDRRKIADVLLMIEKENIKPTSFTYKMLVNVKGKFHDISGMEQILETMKSEGVEPDLLIKNSVAKAYILAGLKEKAKA